MFCIYTILQISFYNNLLSIRISSKVHVNIVLNNLYYIIHSSNEPLYWNTFELFMSLVDAKQLKCLRCAGFGLYVNISCGIGIF